MLSSNQNLTLDLHTARVGTTHMNVKTRGGLTEIQGRINQLGRLSAGDRRKVAPPVTHHDQPRASSRINDNYCVAKLQTRLLAGSSTPTRQTMNTQVFANVNCHVATPVYTAPGLSQKKDVSPGVADCHLKRCKLKSVKSVSCVTQLSCVKPVTNVKNVASNLPVGARLQNYWQTWLDLELFKSGKRVTPSPFGSGQNSQGIPQS